MCLFIIYLQTNIHIPSFTQNALLQGDGLPTHTHTHMHHKSLLGLISRQAAHTGWPWEIGKGPGGVLYVLLPILIDARSIDIFGALIAFNQKTMKMRVRK